MSLNYVTFSGFYKKVKNAACLELVAEHQILLSFGKEREGNQKTKMERKLHLLHLIFRQFIIILLNFKNGQFSIFICQFFSISLIH
jgi:hypothetical protein